MTTIPYIVADNKIPYLKGVLEPYARIDYLSPDRMDANAVRDADILLIRTRTKCNRDLLDQSRCRRLLPRKRHRMEKLPRLQRRFGGSIHTRLAAGLEQKSPQATARMHVGCRGRRSCRHHRRPLCPPAGHAGTPQRPSA